MTLAHPFAHPLYAYLGLLVSAAFMTYAGARLTGSGRLTSWLSHQIYVESAVLCTIGSYGTPSLPKHERASVECRSPGQLLQPPAYSLPLYNVQH